MKSKTIIQAGAFALTALMMAQSAQAADAVANPLAPTSTELASVKPQAPKPVVAAAPVVISTPASMSTVPSIALYRQLDELRSKNALLAESLKNVELKNKIGNVGISPTGQANPNPTGVNGFPSNMAPATAAPLSVQVQMVSASEGQYTALISLSTGGRVKARVGSKLAGLGVVKSISLDEVLLTNKTETISLPFATDGGVR